LVNFSANNIQLSFLSFVSAVVRHFGLFA